MTLTNMPNILDVLCESVILSCTLVPEAFFEHYLFLFGNLRREALIEAPSREKRDRRESHFHAGSALHSCQRCHFLLTNHIPKDI